MDLDQLQALCSNLDNTSKTIKDLCGRRPTVANGHEAASAATSTLFAASSVDEDDISTARKHLYGLSTRLQTLVSEPEGFLQQLAVQTQLLACIKWLGEFQVIACVPLTGSVSTEELADLAGVQEVILSRVVRMTATAGFLHEPEPGYVSHTALSAAFSTDLSYFDAAMFLSNQVAPSAWRLNSVLHQQDDFSSLDLKTASRSSSVSSSHSIGALYAGGLGGPRLTRQCLAYRDSICGADDDSLTDLFRQLNWQSLGEATVVYTCDKYTRETAQALQQISRTLRIVVQTFDSQSQGSNDGNNPRIRVQCRRPKEPQSIKDAALYIVRPPLSSFATNGETSYDLLVAELQSHVGVLRANPAAMLIVAPALLPEPGSVDIGVEVKARLRDFSRLHLGNESALEVTELAKLIENVSDQSGRLVATNRLRSASGAAIALAAQYQTYSQLAVSL